MVIHIPKMCSREELLDLLAPPTNEQRVNWFRAKLPHNEEELLKLQAEGSRIRDMMLKLSDFVITARRISGRHH